MGGEKRGVEGLPLVKDEGQGEVLKREGVGGATHGKAVGFREVHEAAHGGCESIGIADRSEEAGAVGEEGFCSTGDRKSVV